LFFCCFENDYETKRFGLFQLKSIFSFYPEFNFKIFQLEYIQQFYSCVFSNLVGLALGIVLEILFASFLPSGQKDCKEKPVRTPNPDF
jgi:hypothetical protein